MTYIVVKSFAQVGYVNLYIISMGTIRTTQKPFLFPCVNFDKLRNATRIASRNSSENDSGNAQKVLKQFLLL